ncbi:MAG: glycosyltransferase family 4 protein [Akkermansiaceae bacterium]
MAAQLAQLMQAWPKTEVHLINASYTNDRSQLGFFSLRKVFLWLSFLSRVLWLCVTKRIDAILMTHSFFPGPFVKDSAFLWLGKLLGKKIIVWVHMDPNRLSILDSQNILAGYARRVIQLPDLWVACAPSLLKQWPDAFNRSKLTAICNGIVDPQPPSTTRMRDFLRIVYISSMTEEKGWQELLSAAEVLCAEIPNIVFDFYGGVGAGESESHLKEVFSTCAYPEQIQWHGEVWGDQKAQVMADADLFCLPSWTEAFPLAIIDAMACALPVVATRVGGIPDAIVDTENGWLCMAKDRDALLFTLRTALANHDQFTAIGQRNRQRFLNEFSSTAFGQKWQLLLDQSIPHCVS